ncbi:MAG: lamin tail domain-containing protein [Microthrixaceae bacterium]
MTEADRPESAEVATVIEVTDGDTLRVRVDGAEERVRLIGIDTPERGECLADRARQRVVQLVASGEVGLEPDTTDRDQYGRLLRYVHAGDAFVNETLVSEGLAIARRYPPDTARAEGLEAAQDAAERHGVGMWDHSACGPVAGGAADLSLTALNADPPGTNDNENLNGEWVELTNLAEAPVDLTGWGLKDESASHRYGFPNGFELDGRATVRVSSGCGSDTDDQLHWCVSGSAVWNNSGDTAFLLDPSGNIVDTYPY